MVWNSFVNWWSHMLQTYMAVRPRRAADRVQHWVTFATVIINQIHVCIGRITQNNVSQLCSWCLIIPRGTGRKTRHDIHSFIYNFYTAVGDAETSWETHVAVRKCYPGGGTGCSCDFLRGITAETWIYGTHNLSRWNTLTPILKRTEWKQ